MHSVTERVGASKTGADGLMTFISALNSLQDCELFWLESVPEFNGYLLRNGIRMFLVSRQADVIRMPAYGEEITVSTMPYDYSRGIGYRNTAVYGADGRPCILTWAVGAFVSIETGRIANIPQEATAGAIKDTKIDMEYLDRKIQLPESGFESIAPVAVKKRHIDLNGHVNNAGYIEIALDLLPAETRVKRMRAEYKKAAKYGDLLYPQLISYSNKFFVLLNDRDGKPYEITEFTY